MKKIYAIGGVVLLVLLAMFAVGGGALAALDSGVLPNEPKTVDDYKTIFQTMYGAQCTDAAGFDGTMCQATKGKTDMMMAMVDNPDWELAGQKLPCREAMMYSIIKSYGYDDLGYLKISNKAGYTTYDLSTRDVSGTSFCTPSGVMVSFVDTDPSEAFEVYDRLSEAQQFIDKYVNTAYEPEVIEKVDQIISDVAPAETKTDFEEIIEDKKEDIIQQLQDYQVTDIQESGDGYVIEAKREARLLYLLKVKKTYKFILNNKGDLYQQRGGLDWLYGEI